METVLYISLTSDIVMQLATLKVLILIPNYEKINFMGLHM